MSRAWSAWVPTPQAEWEANPVACEVAARSLLTMYAEMAGVSLQSLAFTVLHPVEVNGVPLTYPDPDTGLDVPPVVVLRAEGTRP